MRDPEPARKVREDPWWYHAVDLGDGLIMKGGSENSVLERPGALPDVKGCSVLDIGAWDAKLSFEADRAGATRVVALDHDVRKLDPGRRQTYYDQCEAEGRLPDPEQIDRGFLVGDGHLGRYGFDLLHAYLDSKVLPVVDDFMTMDLRPIGQFDVVFYFGVLHHTVDPVNALRRVHEVTGAVAAIDTAMTVVPGYEGASLVEFFAGKERNADYGNWFAPFEAAFHGMCRAAGFCRVVTAAKITAPPEPSWRTRARRRALPHGGRIVVRVFR